MENELGQDVIGEQPPILPETSAPVETTPVEAQPVDEPIIDEEPEVKDADTLKAEVDALEEKKKKTEEETKRWAKLKREQRDEYFREKKKTDQVQPEKTTAAEPKEEDFDTIEEYESAVNDWKIDQAVTRKAVKTASLRAEKNLGEFVDNLIFDGRERYSDFNEIGQSNANPITKQTLEILNEADFEHPADIVYYLGKNLQESVAISRMTPTAAARKLAKIEETVTAELESNPPETKPTTKIVTDAPAPIIPSGSGGAPITKDPAKMNQAEYEEWRNRGGGK